MNTGVNLNVLKKPILLSLLVHPTTPLYTSSLLFSLFVFSLFKKSLSHKLVITDCKPKTLLE